MTAILFYFFAGVAVIGLRLLAEVLGKRGKGGEQKPDKQENESQDSSLHHRRAWGSHRGRSRREWAHGTDEDTRSERLPIPISSNKETVPGKPSSF